MGVNFNWECPYCGHSAVIRSDVYQEASFYLHIDNKHGYHKVTVIFIVCPNKKCREFILNFDLFHASQDHFGNYIDGTLIKTWRVRPESGAKPWPDYVPKSIIEDYTEACLIVDKSPKASATLARRCLQGMIRDFWGINKSRLIDEIDALKSKPELNDLTVATLHALREIANIGAHPERDINLIIDIQPKEAEIMIHGIETLLEEWYVHRHRRQEKMKALITLADDKSKQKNGPEK